jgi:cell division protein FtsB
VYIFEKSAKNHLKDLFSLVGEVYNQAPECNSMGLRETVDHKSLMQGVIVRIALAVFGLLTVAMLLLAVFNDRGALEVQAQARKLSAIESDISRLDAENKQLTTEIQALRSDPATIEKFAREELKLVRPGEIVIVTPEN